MNLLTDLLFCGFIPGLDASPYFYNQQNTKFFDEVMTDPQLIDYTKWIEVKRRGDVLSNYQEIIFWEESGIWGRF